MNKTIRLKETSWAESLEKESIKSKDRYGGAPDLRMRRGEISKDN